MLKSHQKLSGIIPRSDLVEFPFSLQMMEKLSTIHKCQDEIKLFRRLERKLERDDEWAIDFGEYGPFS
jgi:hypothetical protein